MAEVEKLNRFWVWMEGSAWGRKVLAVMDRVRGLYHQHLDRYHNWGQTSYRFYTWLVTIAILLVALALLAGTFKVGRHYYRQYREKRWQAEGEAFLAQGDVRNAALSAQLVLQINPNNVPACRVMAQIADRFHSPQTLEWLRHIAQAEPTTENKLMLAMVGLNYQQPPFPLTVQLLDELAPAATNTVGYQMVAARLALQTSRLAEAEARFETAIALEPTNRTFQLNLAIIRLGSTNAATTAAARATLDQFRTDAELGPPALRSLAANCLVHQDAAGALDFSRQLLANPQATLQDRLQNLGILRQLKSDELNRRLQTVEQEVATNVLAVAEVSGWMQANGMVAESLDWLTGLPIPMLDQRPVQMALAQGYLQTRNWKALRDIASQGNWGNLEYLRFAMNYRALSELGSTGEAASNWNAAMANAASRREAMMQLLQLVESWKLEPQREDLLLHIVQAYPQEKWAQQELELLDFTSGNTLGLHQLYSVLNGHFPTNTDYRNNLAATALLLKIDLPKARELAAETYAGKPGDPIVASTYAYALHLQGRDKQGLAVLQKFAPDELAQPPVALYYGVLLAANGMADQAKPWLQIAQTKGQLLPEEQHLLSDALGKIRNPPGPD
jgi:cytochrome c-type biogenesis protein CcmH/NrfG